VTIPPDQKSFPSETSQTIAVARLDLHKEISGALRIGMGGWDGVRYKRPLAQSLGLLPEAQTAPLPGAMDAQVAELWSFPHLGVRQRQQLVDLRHVASGHRGCSGALGRTSMRAPFAKVDEPPANLKHSGMK
jgi:hypothetical protein